MVRHLSWIIYTMLFGEPSESFSYQQETIVYGLDLPNDNTYYPNYIDNNQEQYAGIVTNTNGYTDYDVTNNRYTDHMI